MGCCPADCAADSVPRGVSQCPALVRTMADRLGSSLVSQGLGGLARNRADSTSSNRVDASGSPWALCDATLGRQQVRRNCRSSDVGSQAESRDRSLSVSR